MKTLVFNEAKWLKIFSLAMIVLAVYCCQPEDDLIVAPTVKSVGVSNITKTSATISGMVSFDGGSEIIEQGIYLDETKKIPANYVNGEFVFSVTVSNLTPGTSYSAKAYATNTAGMSYGENLEFTTLVNSGDTTIVNPGPTPEPLPNLEILEAENVDIHSAVLRGVVKRNYALEELTFIFEYGLNQNFDKSIQAESWINSSDDMIAISQVNNLEASSTYYYRLKVIDNKGEFAYSPVTSFTTSDEASLAFSIPDTEIDQVETDKDGNVYVTGEFFNNSNYRDVLVAKFNNEGQLVWRYNVVTDNTERSRGGLVIKDDILYVHITRNEMVDKGNLYVDAYNCKSGELIWSSKVSEEWGRDLKLSDDGFIYSVSYNQITKLNLSGEIVSQFTTQGTYMFEAISIYDNNRIFVGAHKMIGGVYEKSQEAAALCFDGDLNFLWDISRSIQKTIAGFFSIISFPEQNLVCVGASMGVLSDGTPMEASIMCYRVEEDKLVHPWSISFDNSTKLGLKREGDTFYAYSADYSANGNLKAPILLDLEGNILWTSSVKINGHMAIFDNKMYVANCSDFLTVVSM